MSNSFTRMDGQAVKAKLSVAFRNFSKAPIQQPTHKLCVDWIPLVLDRTQRPALVNMVMGNALPSSRTMELLTFWHPNFTFKF